MPQKMALMVRKGWAGFARVGEGFSYVFFRC